MAVELSIVEGTGDLGDVVAGWSVNEATTPANPSVAPANLGSISFSAKSRGDSAFLVADRVRLTHEELGEQSGLVGDITVSDYSVDGTVLGYASLLDVDRVVPPLSSGTLSNALTQYISYVTDDIELDYQGDDDPIVVFPGWEGNVWQHLNQLCALYNLRINMQENVMVVSDTVTEFFDITDHSNETRNISNQSSGMFIDVAYNQPVDVLATTDTIWNYSQNPSLESDTIDWDAAAGLGAIESGRTTAEQWEGAYSFYVKVTNGGTSPNFVSFIVLHTIDVSDLPVGERYLGSIRYKLALDGNPTYARRITMRLEWLNASGTPLASTGAQRSYAMPASGATPWLIYNALPMIKPYGATQARFVFEAPPNANGTRNFYPEDILYLDGAMLTNASTYNYFDGNSSGASWSGTTNNSRSYYTVVDTPVILDLYDEDNTILSVNAGETNVTTISTNTYPTYVEQPTVSNAIPLLPGRYIVSASDDLMVDQQQWIDYGGSVTVDIGDSPGTFTITFVGPRQEIPGVPGPYSLSVSDGDNEYATLSVRGQGVKTYPVTRRFSTGADPARTTNEVALTFESPFVSTLHDATNAAAKLMIDAAGPVVTLSVDVNPRSLERFGKYLGAVTETRDSIYRHESISISRNGATLTSRPYVTSDKLESVWYGETAEDFEEFWSGKTAGDFMIEPLRFG